MWTEKCKSITTVQQIAIKKYICTMANRLVVSSVTENTYSSRIFIQLIIKIDPRVGGYFGHAVIYKIERTERSRHHHLQW